MTHSREACARKCASLTNCKSFDWNISKNECYINGDSEYLTPTFQTTDHYRKECGWFQKPFSILYE